MMTLLEIITKAAADAKTTLKTPSDYPIILNPDPIFPLLQPQIDQSSPLQRVQGWKISDLDSHIIQLSHRFFKKLKRKLQKPNSLTRTDFFDLLNSFLDKNREVIGLRIELGPDDPDYTHRAIEKLGFQLGRDVAALISEACVALDLWELLETLILQGLVAGDSTDLVESLVSKRRSHTLCLFIKHVADIRSSDLLLILKYFLSPPKGAYAGMAVVRKEWESKALSSIERAAAKRSPPATRAAVLLAAAHDGFSAPELCLHYLLGSENVDELSMSSAVAGLSGAEMLRLVRYLGKWLRKYERFPEAAAEQEMEICRWVPSLESVVGCFGLVVDEHFSYLVLCSEIHEELRSMERVVRSLESEAAISSSVENVIENLRLDAGLQ